MGDVGIDLLKPRYERPLLVAADTAYWEVTYTDGTALCEAQGGTYGQIDRSRLSSFKLVHNGEVVFEIFPPPGVRGDRLIYRRRTSLGQSAAGRGVVFILGWAPLGPLFLVDIEHGQYYEDTVGILPTLSSMPGEPDDLLLNPRG